MVVGGREALGQFSLHAVTDPSARGLGIFRGLEQRHEEEGERRGSTVFLVFPNGLTGPLFLGPLGWTLIDRRRVWARPLRGAARQVLRRGTGTALGPISVRGNAGVERVETFDPSVDAVYAALAPRLGNHVVRDSGYLNWRYCASPREYRCLRSANGFAVVGRTVRKGRSLALLMELLAPPAEASALVRRCVAEARGAAALLALPSPLLPKSTLRRLGFLPTPSRLDFMGKGVAGPLDADPSHWGLSLGDADFF
jgi:hypothetical protein